MFSHAYYNIWISFSSSCLYYQEGTSLSCYGILDFSIHLLKFTMLFILISNCPVAMVKDIMNPSFLPDIGSFKSMFSKHSVVAVASYPLNKTRGLAVVFCFCFCFCFWLHWFVVVAFRIFFFLFVALEIFSAITCELSVVARGILVLWPGIKPGPLAVGAQGLCHWTAKEVPA